GLTNWNKTSYGGPCPPIGRHRYFHKLYALDVMLPDLKNPSKEALLAAMENHVIAKTEMIGTYQKQ
ncbi:MAG TPA: YbhB/YbcL family Raf kinase inhibitor-like protein, partial [Candidatus Berkiella sp.]|nr:YbhB/YbcL family Raf kinase inhibitor-like protein [Candidatus Berkiella sp.]